jgi:hypothetical protein
MGRELLFTISQNYPRIHKILCFYQNAAKRKTQQETFFQTRHFEMIKEHQTHSKK